MVFKEEKELPIIPVITFSILFITIIFILIAIKGKHHYYWYASLGMLVFSILSGFSIGRITIGVTFLLLSLAIGYSLYLIQNKLNLITFLALGLLFGLLLEYWLIY